MSIDSNLYVTLLKKYTSVDPNFIDTFFSKFKLGSELVFNIEDIKVAKYLKISLLTLRERLRNKYANNIIYVKGVDYQIVSDENDKRKKIYLLNYESFEKVAMATETVSGSMIRDYFSKIRKFIYENRIIINQALNNKEVLDKLYEKHVIYFFVADPQYPDILKLGRTEDIISRLEKYNTGRIYEPELKYLAVVKNSLLLESCVKALLKKNNVFNRTELFQISVDKMEKSINICYKKLTSKTAHDKLYAEINALLGMYSYVKIKRDCFHT